MKGIEDSKLYESQDITEDTVYGRFQCCHYPTHHSTLITSTNHPVLIDCIVQPHYSHNNPPCATSQLATILNNAGLDTVRQ